MNTPQPLATRAGSTSLIARATMALRSADGITSQPAVRRALPAIGLLAVVLIGLLGWVLLAPAERVSLMSALPPAEKARALDVLTAQGLDAQLDPSSGQMTVTATDFHRARMILASEGLPQGAVDGLSALTDMPMGTSRQVENARLRRMQELDLARSIMELGPVRTARVHLALPERSAFVRDTQPPRASVFVELAPGGDLDQSQVRAIVSLVATAVADMPKANISVVDQTGRLLTTLEDDPVQEEANRQLQHQRQLENAYRDRVLALLTPMLGRGNAAVEITVDMDFTRTEITSEEFLPDTTLRSEQSSLQETSGRRAEGVPGAIANLPPPEAELAEGEAVAEQTTGTTSTSTSTTRNFEVSRRLETRQPQTAQIRRVHAAILVHKDAVPSDDPLAPPPMLTEIEALAKNAIGFDATRGDQVIVTAAPFLTTELPMTTMRWFDADWLPALGRGLAQLAVLAIIVLGVVRPVLQQLLPAGGSNGGGMTLGDAVEVPKGEAMYALRERLQTSAPDADDLNGAITYEEKVALLREMAGSETNRIAGAFKSMLTPAEDKQP